MSDQQAINWDEVVGYVQQTGDKNVWGKLTEQERPLYLEALKRWQAKSPGIAGRPDSAMIGAGGQSMLNPEDIFLAGSLVKGVKHLVSPKNIIKGGPQTLGRAHVNKGGVVDKAGLPGKMEVMGETKALGTPANLQKVGRKEFTEVEKRANMFGGAKVEGQAVKPNARQPISLKPSEELSEAERLVQEIMKGKNGGSLPNNARRGAVLKSPKKK